MEKGQIAKLDFVDFAIPGCPLRTYHVELVSRVCKTHKKEEVWKVRVMGSKTIERKCISPEQIINP